MFRLAHLEDRSARVDADERSFDVARMRDGVTPVNPVISLPCRSVRTQAP
jgi:hypothetical protein